MRSIRRFIAVAVLIGLVGLFTNTIIWGEPAGRHANKGLEEQKRDVRLNLDGVKFAELPLVTFKDKDGKTLFALQVKPTLEAVAPRPRDYVVLVSTGASMAQGDLTLAQLMIEGLAKSAGAEDRIALLTVNTKPKDLSNGFQPADKLEGAFKDLKKEVPFGSGDLKSSVAQALKLMPEERRARQQVVVYLGDGKSLMNPLSADDRAELCRKMVKNKITFFSIPMGLNMEPANLHGFATATGGAIVRLQLGEKPEEALKRLSSTIGAPVLYPTKFEKPAQFATVYPDKELPPVRADQATLVAGVMAPDVKVGEKITYRITGTLAGKEVRIEKTEKVSAPEDENFFLASIVNQWVNAKDRPAMMAADRLLCMSFDNAQMARADLLAQAEMALGDKQFEAAMGIFQQVLALDPSNGEAKAGKNLADGIRQGKIDPKQLEERLKQKPADRLIGAKVDDKDPPPPGAQPGNPPGAPDAFPNQPDKNQFLEDVKRRQDLEDERTTHLVEDAIRRAQKQMFIDPAGARDSLKRDLEALLANPNLSPSTRGKLQLRVEAARRNIDVQGARIQRDIDTRLQQWQQAVERQRSQDNQRMEDDRVAARVAQFHDLMNRARDEEAWRLMKQIEEERIDQGLPVPTAVTAGYRVGVAAQYLREYNTLKAARAEQFLAVQMQLERSFMPFPDEPPIHFPPAKVWQELTKRRKDHFNYLGFGADLPPQALELQSKMNSPVRLAPGEEPFGKDTKISEALDWLAKYHKFPLSYNESAFKAADPNYSFDTYFGVPLQDKSPFPWSNNLSLSTVLQKILARVPTDGDAKHVPTWMIRRDTIEITTTEAQLYEKSIRVYPVLDLVIPTPNNVAHQIQSTIFGLQTGLGALGLGGALGGGLPLGGGLAGGLPLGGGLAGGGLALGGGLAGGFPLGGGLAGGGLALGGLALGGGGLALGGGLAGGLPLGGGLAGGGLALGGGLAGGLPFGGGLAGGGLALGGALGGGLALGGALGGGLAGGLAGGALGGGGLSLGGQYGGYLGAQQSTLLIYLIRNLVGTPEDWDMADPTQLGLQQVPGPGGQPAQPVNQPGTTHGNQLGFYGPAGALVVKGTSRITSRAQSPFVGKGPDQPLALGNDPKRPAGGAVADANGKRGDKLTTRTVKLPPGFDKLDSKTMWQKALEEGATDPGLIIACADALALNRKWEDSAEFLKADLRMGIVVEPWVFESLAIALRESKASAEEIERAEVSAIDLQPTNAQGYLKAAAALREMKMYDRAGALTRQAALLEPEMPQIYKEALVCAEAGKDADTLAWAAGNLMRRDWPADNKELQTQASTRVDSLARTLDKQDRKKDAQKLRAILSKQSERDIRIKASWQGECDLDLKVEEPSGSVCSYLNRLTIGGGTLLGGTLSESNSQEYVAAEAFSGEYKVRIDRGWGHPLGEKVQIAITQYDGTPHRTTQIETIDLSKSNTLTVKLILGRRTQAASVPPPGALRKTPPQLEPSAADVLAKLRGVAEARSTGVDAVRTGAGGFGQMVPNRDTATSKPNPELSGYQTKISSTVQNTVDMAVKAVVSPDSNEVHVSMTPLYNMRGTGPKDPIINNPLLPGGK